MGVHKKFKSPEELQSKIDEYFESTQRHTVEGLCAALECDRRTLINYQKAEGYEAFFHTIEKAKQKILDNFIDKSLNGEYVPSVAIFLLKNNNGYRDKFEQGFTDSDGNDIKEIKINVVSTREDVEKL